MMGEYRFQRLDAAMQSIGDITLMCLNDADALMLAERIGRGAQVEVWERDRLVGFARCGSGRTEDVAA